MATQTMDYVHANPHAKDSAEGIAHWWNEYDVDVSEVRQVLEQLVELELLCKRSTESGEIYSAAESPEC